MIVVPLSLRSGCTPRRLNPLVTASRQAMRPVVVVAGQFARDLVVVVDRMPGPGESGMVQQRRDMLGGKGANQTLALAQLGLGMSRTWRRAAAATRLSARLFPADFPLPAF